MAKNLATRIDVPYLSVNSLVRREKLHHGYDRKVSSYILDQNRVSRRIGSILSNTHGAIFDTNYVQGIIPRKRNSIAIVLRLDPVILYNRLRRRGWNKRKCWENAEAELVDSTLIDTINSLGNRRVFQIDTTHRSQAELEKIAMKIINGKMEKSDRIDWLAKYDPIKLQRRFS